MDIIYCKYFVQITLYNHRKFRLHPRLFNPLIVKLIYLASTTEYVKPLNRLTTVKGLMLLMCMSVHVVCY